jgi:hypothetical protein
MNDVEHLIEQLADDGTARGAGSVFLGATQRAARHRKVRARRRIVSGAAVIIAVVVVVALVAQLSASKPDYNGIRIAGEPTTTVGSTPVVAGATAAQLAAGHWSVVPAARISPRGGASVVWTGKELLVWGGQIGERSKRDGAAYDPGTRAWRLLPDSPILPTGSQTAVWTGSEMVVVRGVAAAAYRPASNSWRSLPELPIPATGTLLGVWTGGRVIVLAGAVAASYDAATNTWQRLPSIPMHRKPGWEVQKGFVTAAVAAEPGVVFAWSEWAAQRPFGVNGTEGTGGSDLVRYDAATNEWTAKAAGHAGITELGEAFWTGGRLLARGDMHLPGATGPGPLPEVTAWYDPDTGTATRLPPDALTSRDNPVRGLSSAWTGRALWSLNTQESAGNIQPGAASVYDPVANTWQRIASAPFGCRAPSAPVWTGTSVFVYCPQTYQSHLHPAGPVGGLQYDVG